VQRQKQDAIEPTPIKELPEPNAADIIFPKYYLVQPLKAKQASTALPTLIISLA